MLPDYQSLASVGVLPPRCAYSAERTVCLNGEWEIRAYASARDALASFRQNENQSESAVVPQFLRDGGNCAFGKIDVPSCVQYYGYDTFQYTNIDYPFPFDPPHVPYENPAFHYRKRLTLQREEKRYYLTFDGVDSCFYLYINGKFIGFSQISHRTSEFDVSDAITDGENTIDVLVLKWCAGSYLEDQDKWRFTGIFRDVSLLIRPNGHIRDYKIETQTDGTVTFTYLSGEKEARVTLCGESKMCEAGQSVTFSVRAPKLWSAETPYLYAMQIECAGETISEKVGIRTVTAENGVFKINGKHVKLKGVNRHDFHPEKGAAVSEEDMHADLLLMKKLHVNAVRASHYPSAPAFYRLCDELGFYVMSEADVECHGAVTQYGDWSYAYASTILENADYAEAILERNMSNVQAQKNRPCVIAWSLGNECGYGDVFIRAAKRVKEADGTRLVHYHGAFCPGQNPTKKDNSVFDIVSFMCDEGNEDAGTRLRAFLSDTTEHRPAVYCEYSHAMGNGPGDLTTYRKLFDSSDRCMGGFVWEWKEQGVLYPKNESAVVPQYKYGGDFGEYPHFGSFCIDGIVGPLLEYRPSAAHIEKVFAERETDTAYGAPPVYVPKISLTKASVKIAADGDTRCVTCADARYSVDLRHGGLEASCGGIRLLEPFAVSIVRAPIDNDMFIKEEWKARGIFDAHPYIVQSNFAENSIVLEGKMLAVSRASCLDFTLSYTFFAEGVEAELRYTIPESVKSLPRVGLVCALPVSFSDLTYCGLGETETYVDTTELSVFGKFDTTVEKNFTNYIKPQECGSHCGTRYVCLGDGEHTVEISAAYPFSFSALPYSESVLRTTAHNWQLPPPSATYLSLDIAMRGIGSRSCGPKLQSEYEIPRSGCNRFGIKLGAKSCKR